jgi:hypothetical protein
MAVRLNARRTELVFNYLIAARHPAASASSLEQNQLFVFHLVRRIISPSGNVINAFTNPVGVGFDASREGASAAEAGDKSTDCEFMGAANAPSISVFTSRLRQAHCAMNAPFQREARNDRRGALTLKLGYSFQAGLFVDCVGIG